MKLIVLGLVYIFAALFLAVSCHAAEKDYIATYCTRWGGITEVELPSGARADCETKHNIYEFEFASKWAEAIGQCLHYSAITEKHAKIALICTEPDDTRFITRLLATIRYHNLPITINYIDCVKQ